MPAVYFLYYGFISIVMPGWKVNQWLDQNMMAHFWSFGPLAWWWLAIGLLGTAVIFIVSYDEYKPEAQYDYKSGNYTRPPHPVTFRYLLDVLVVVCVAFVLSGVQIVRTTWDNDKDFARYYNETTTYYAPDLQSYPQSLKRLIDGAKTGDGERCDLVGAADVPSCITQGELSTEGWDPRVGSLDGAAIAIKRRSGDVQKVSLKTDTLVYLNAWKGQPAGWSGVLDGSGITQSLGGVSEWTGEGEPTQCLFDNEYEIDRAFDGGRSNSLRHLLADRYPSLRFTLSDVWGYCEPVADSAGTPVMDPNTGAQLQQPVVVVPMTRQIYFKDRTVDTAAGIITVRGDHGKTKLQYLPTVKAGEYPGPVYPASLAVTQRQEASWAAGRQNRKRNGFGYDPASSEVQAGNVSEYLLRNSITGRLEWVTPLTLRNSSSELFVAYAIIPADEVTNDELNQLSVYVLADNDPRRVNIDNLESDARNYFAKNAGTFISNGGKLVEFTPINGNVWRAFGELNGQVIYRLDISADKTVAPSLVSLNNEPTVETSDNAVCGQPVAQLTPSDLTNCLKLFADELVNKQTNQGNASSG